MHHTRTGSAGLAQRADQALQRLLLLCAAFAHELADQRSHAHVLKFARRLTGRAQQLRQVLHHIALAGQLIVFETLAALAYAFLLRGDWPNIVTQIGIGLLMIGVLWGVRIKPELIKANSSD